MCIRDRRIISTPLTNSISDEPRGFVYIRINLRTETVYILTAYFISVWSKSWNAKNFKIVFIKFYGKKGEFLIWPDENRESNLQASLITTPGAASGYVTAHKCTILSAYMRKRVWALSGIHTTAANNNERESEWKWEIVRERQTERLCK